MPFTCRFFDGQRSVPHWVQVTILSDGLSIVIIENETEKKIVWGWQEILVTEPPQNTRAAVLGCKTMIGARLNIQDSTLYKTILSNIPKSNIKLSTVEHPWRRVFLIVALSILLLCGLLVGIPLGAPFLALHMPPSWDDKLGQMIIKQFTNDSDVCSMPSGQKALEKIVKRLSEQLPLKPHFDVKVIKMGKEEINAVCVPGNHIIIFSGLIDFADSPDEVAGVLAHEMGHAMEHHPTQGLIRKIGIKVVLGAAFGSQAEYASDFLNLKYTRNDEQQADDIAVGTLKKARINTRGLATFFEKLHEKFGAKVEHQKILTYFSDHPGLLERVERILAQGKQQNTTPSLSAQEWQALKGICQQKTPLNFE